MKIKGFSLFDIIILCLATISIISTAIIFNSTVLLVVSSLLGIIMVALESNAKAITPLVSIAFFIFYIIISINESLWGEAILYTLIMIPLYVISTIIWLKNKTDNGEVLIRKNLSTKEWVAFLPSFIIITILSYCLLAFLNTAELIFSVLSFVSTLFATYIMLRRVVWNKYLYAINDIIVCILWLLVIINGELSVIPICLCCLFQGIYDIYGIIVWKKLEIKQNKQ